MLIPIFRANHLPPVCTKGEKPMIFKIIALAIIIILLVMDYALLVIAHDADEKAERMYRAWKEGKDE